MKRLNNLKNQISSINTNKLKNEKTKDDKETNDDNKTKDDNKTSSGPNGGRELSPIDIAISNTANPTTGIQTYDNTSGSSSGTSSGKYVFLIQNYRDIYIYIYIYIIKKDGKK